MSDFKTNVGKMALMMRVQDGINCEASPDWHERRHPWHRPIWTECAKMMDHVGLGFEREEKDTGLALVKASLVHVWRNGLSILIQSARSDQYEEIAISIGNTVFEPSAGAQIDIRLAIEKLAEVTLSDKHFHVNQFARLMALSGLSFDELYKTYVSENVFSKFRIDYGRKKNVRYKKVWNGRDDRDVLSEIVRGMNTESEEFPALLRAELERVYELATS